MPVGKERVGAGSDLFQGTTFAFAYRD